MTVFLIYVCIGLIFAGSISVYYHKSRIEHYERIERMEELLEWCSDETTELGREINVLTRRNINHMKYPSPGEYHYLFKHYHVAFEIIGAIILTISWPVVLFITVYKR